MGPESTRRTNLVASVGTIPMPGHLNHDNKFRMSRELKARTLGFLPVRTRLLKSGLNICYAPADSWLRKTSLFCEDDSVVPVDVTSIK